MSKETKERMKLRDSKFVVRHSLFVHFIDTVYWVAAEGLHWSKER